MSMFTTTKPKQSKIGNAFSSHISTVGAKLPGRIGGNENGQTIQQRQALPAGNSYTSAPVTGTKQETVGTPQAGPDIYQATGTQGIDRIGKAATQEVVVKVQAQRAAEAKAQEDALRLQMEQANAQVQNGLATLPQGNTGVDWGAQQGVSTSPITGPNGSASWINANNNKYHDFDGAFGAQCVDLYNFYMTGFVGGRSSVGQVNYAYELWQRHDTSTLVQVGRNQKPQMGDIAIWSNAMNGVGGHVAIVSQDNGNGTIRVLNANVASNGGSRGTSVMSNLSTGTLLGYLRPRKLM